MDGGAGPLGFSSPLIHVLVISEGAWPRFSSEHPSLARRWACVVEGGNATSGKCLLARHAASVSIQPEPVPRNERTALNAFLRVSAFECAVRGYENRNADARKPFKRVRERHWIFDKASGRGV